MSRFKKFLKHANRGVTLGGIVLIALIVYINVEHSRFKKEMPEIKERLNNYVNEMIELSITSEPLGTLDKNNSQDNIVDVVNEYWCPPKSTTNSWCTTKSNLVSNIDLIYSNTDNTGYITNASHQLSNLKIKKAAPNCAIVTTNLSTSYTASDSCDFITPFDILYVSNELVTNYYSYGNKTIPFKNGEQEYAITHLYDCTITLYRTDGKWKIENAEFYPINENFQINDVKEVQ